MGGMGTFERGQPAAKATATGSHDDLGVWRAWNVRTSEIRWRSGSHVDNGGQGPWATWGYWGAGSLRWRCDGGGGGGLFYFSY
jgi:hypothetical protein